MTHVFDRVQGINWPEVYPGRAFGNTFNDEWYGLDDDVSLSSDAGKTFHAHQGNYAIDFLHAGQAVGLVNDANSAESVVKGLGEGAEQWLRYRFGHPIRSYVDSSGCRSGMSQLTELLAISG